MESNQNRVHQPEEDHTLGKKNEMKNYSLGERNGALPRALASHRCGSNYIPKLSSVLQFSLIGYFFDIDVCLSMDVYLTNIPL